MKFKKLAEYFDRIEKTASRLKMTEILGQVFKEATVDEIDQIVYLALGTMRPKFEGIEFNLAEKMMLRVLSAAYGAELKRIAKEFKQIGDLGEVIQRLASSELASRKNLSVAEVYKRLMDVAVDEGQGSQDRKVQSMARLLKDLDLVSAKFVVRIPVNKLRLGFSSMTVLDALSWMEKGDKSLRVNLERAFNVSADIGRIATVFKKEGLKGVAGIKVKVGVPIRAAQAERLPSAEKIVEKLEVFAVEGKWDGLRVQIHFDSGRQAQLATQENLFGGGQGKLVRIFSRNLDNQTQMFPEIVTAAEALKVKQVILDGEAVAYDPKTGRLLGFQDTVTRKRKHGVSQQADKLPVKVFVYDLLYIDGENLIEKPFQERRKRLEKVFNKRPPFAKASEGLILSNQEIVSDVKRLRELMTKYLKLGLEGVMCKKLTTAYQAGSRNFNWVKFKKTTEGELVDTVDTVVMGYYAGKGKRSGFGIGAFLVGVPANGSTKSEARNSKQEYIIGSIAKIGTGLSDEQWRELKARSTKHEIRNKPKEYLVDKNLNCDVWVKPEMVVEIMADEITRSPIHAFGLALRFPRLISFRDDKSVNEATSKKELERLFEMQKVVA